MCNQKIRVLSGLPILVVDGLASGGKETPAGTLSQGNLRERSSSMAVKDDSKVEMKYKPIARINIWFKRKKLLLSPTGVVCSFACTRCVAVGRGET